MARLLTSIGNIKDHYEVVVIGSGYGGGVAASRLARAGRQVCILERGKEFQPGEYPNTEADALKEFQVDLPAHHIGSDIRPVSGSGNARGHTRTHRGQRGGSGGALLPGETGAG